MKGGDQRGSVASVGSFWLAPEAGVVRSWVPAFAGTTDPVEGMPGMTAGMPGVVTWMTDIGAEATGWMHRQSPVVPAKAGTQLETFLNPGHPRAH